MYKGGKDLDIDVKQKQYHPERTDHELLHDTYKAFFIRPTQGVSRLQRITAGGDFLGLCDEKSSYKHVSDFGRLRSYDRLKLRIEGNDY